MANDDKQGRTLEQITKDGTGSAASMGTGGTGDTGRTSTDAGYDEAAHRPWEGGLQSAGRTDDLLSDGSDADSDGEGFAGGPRDQELVEGTAASGNRAGSGAGNLQSGQRPDQDDEHQQSLSGGGRPSDPTGLQGASGNQSGS
jgi:hypothetical protein